MNLIEVFDTKYDLKWIRKDRFKLSSFTIDNQEFVLQIDERPLHDISPDLKNKKTAELSFFIKGDGFSTLLNNNKHALKIYSIIGNGFHSQIQAYDAIFFKIDKSHSKTLDEFKSKKNIYEMLAYKLKSNFNNFVYTKRIKNGLGYLLFKESVNLTESLTCIPLEMLDELETVIVDV